MAGLQYKNNPRVEDDTHGYSAGVSEGAVNDWQDVGLSGSHRTVIYWDDTCHDGQQEARTYMTITDSWTATVDSVTNRITIRGTSSYSMNRVALRQGYWDCSQSWCFRNIYVYNWRGGSQIGGLGGSCIATTGVILSGSRDWSITLEHGQSTSSGTFFVRNETVGYESVYYDLVSAGVQFRNTLPAPKYTPSANVACSGYSSGNVIGGYSSISSIDYGCPSGNDCSANLTTITLYSDAEFTNEVSSTTTKSTSASADYKGLTPNHTYYVKYTVTNGMYSKEYTCSFTTLASSYPYGYKYMTDQVSWLYLQISNGDDACDITTKLYIRESGASDWTLFDTTTSEATVRETLRNIIERGKTYQAYSTTENCTGIYTSAIYEFAPPAADSITGVITTYSSTLQESGVLADIEYCYKITSYIQEEVSGTNPMTSRLEYSLNQQDWIPTDDATSTVNPDTVCGTLTGLQCGTTYYLRSYQKINDVSSYSAVVQLATPTCADFNNCVCDNLAYMTELICQQLHKIRTGQKTIFTNCDTKETCDPYSDNPTLASILSRLLRFDQAAACLICSMEALDIFKSGDTDQVFAASNPGEAGQWVTMDYYPTEGSENLITNSGVGEAIQDYIKSVFHPIGTYEYWAENMADLDEQSVCESGDESESYYCDPPVEGDRAVIGTNYYTYTGEEWVLTGEVPDVEDFGVITILKGEYYDKNFYWWDDDWRLLNITGAGSIETKVDELEDYLANAQIVNNYEGKQYKVAVVDDSLSDDSIKSIISPDSKCEIVIFTTSATLPSADIPVLETDVVDDMPIVISG